MRLALHPASVVRAGEPPLGLVTLTVMLGSIMAIIDASIVNVALDTMAGNLGAEVDEIDWVATGYILACVIVMPLNGFLTARFGRRKYYAACIAIFTIASFMCGTARSIWVLVLYRVIQGFGGGALQPTAQAILFESYPLERRASAMAIFGIGAMFGPAIGPTLGGYIVDNASWPLIFYINVPIGIVAFVMTLLFIRDPVYVERRSGLDFVGLGFLVVGLSSLQYVLERGQELDWFSSGQIVGLTALAVVALAAFVVRELLERAPLVDLRVFRLRSFSAGNVLGIVTGFGMFGTALILPLFTQLLLGFTAFEAGMALLPGAFATVVSMLLAAQAVRRVDGRAVIAVGLVLFAVGSWWMGGLDQDAGYWNIAWPRALQGLGMGLIFVPLSTLTMADVPRPEMANATGIYTLIRQLGGSLGIAILVFAQTVFQDQAYAALAASVTYANPDVVAAMHDRGLTPIQLYQLVDANALMISYDRVLRLCAVVFAFCLPLVAALRGGAIAERP
jgi:MFS transporter, DHA2 family, multidrug resistance protein